MIRNRIVAVCLVAALALGFCACDEFVTTLSTSNTDVVLPLVEIDIGLALPLTGEHASAYGFSMQRGFHLARNEITFSLENPVWITFITEDDMSTIDGAVNAYQHLVDAGVPAIVGTAISTQAKQAFPIAQENGVVAFSSVSTAAGLSSIGDYIFRAGLATDKINPAGVKVTHANLGYERVALIYNHADVFSTASNADVNAALMELGVEVATTQTFQTGYTDLSAQLTAIMESNPDALFVSALASQVVTTMTQGREMGLTAQYIVPELSMNEVAMAGGAAEGAITLTGWSIESSSTRGWSVVSQPVNRLNAATMNSTASAMSTDNFMRRSQVSKLCI